MPANVYRRQLMFPILGIPNKDGEPGLIGISGKAGVGKDTLGKYLCDEYQCLHYYFAKPLNEGAKIMFASVSYTHLTLPTNREV